MTQANPYQRLLAHPEALEDIDARRLAAQLEATNPAAARRQVGQLCATLLERVRRKTVTAPSPNRPRLPIQNQDQQGAGQAGIFG
jgi:hypothetical protein